MRAAVFDGSAVSMRDVTLAAPGPGEVAVRIVAAGVCHSDLHVVKGEWTVPTPVVLGHEGAGVVTAVGEGVTGLAPGDHVVLSWIAPCGECRQCRAGHEVGCELAGGVVGPLGVLNDGTSRLSVDGGVAHHYLGVSSFAEHAVVPAAGAVKVRGDVPLERVAVVGCAVATGVGAVLNTAQVTAGATVVVVGCGGVGLSVVQGARLAGASRIVAVDLRAARLATARGVGATDAVDAAAGDPVAQVREMLPGGADFAFDAIGLPVTSEQVIAMLGVGGTAVLVGLPPEGQQVRFDALAFVEADQRILGSNYGGIRPATDIPLLVDMYADGRLDLDALVTRTRPLEEVGVALDDLEAGRVVRTILLPGISPEAV